ncbi:hypothetical protein H310_12592 [Aphanomyces invadans]|uniref:Uncharacterized protein n=1 Tax=Aphanomyces invadans TaxID=157072 RepID=A0A024TH22_9STRA|nr:hypothetical protein H310_12592 [Aphanomyces invadans]ETV93304.1 hypothetical protein H310_12592 [Aphanomyces invadans]|eukprot:XP_008877940.1 hypothetical protein H310_12592 [Aphanomyces invadans]
MSHLGQTRHRRLGGIRMRLDILQRLRVEVGFFMRRFAQPGASLRVHDEPIDDNAPPILPPACSKFKSSSGLGSRIPIGRCLEHERKLASQRNHVMKTAVSMGDHVVRAVPKLNVRWLDFEQCAHVVVVLVVGKGIAQRRPDVRGCGREDLPPLCEGGLRRRDGGSRRMMGLRVLGRVSGDR